MIEDLKEKMDIMSKEMRDISRKMKTFKRNKWEFQNRKLQDLI